MNGPYDNFFLSNEIEDQYNSHLDLERFCIIDRSLETNVGMKKIVHRYSATDGTQKLAMGEGNTQTITASYQDFEYDIECAQNRFSYYDEEEMKDPMIVLTGTNHMGVDLYNQSNDDLYAEYLKASMVYACDAFDFNSIVSAVACLNIPENVEEQPSIFAFINADDVAGLRIELKDDLKYIEAFVRTGYVGTVAGVNVYTKKDAQRSKMVIATKEAVTKFIKTGVQMEDERESNIRKNTKYARKYYVTALTDDTKVVVLEKSVAVTGVSMKSSLSLKVGETGKLNAKVEPIDASNASITYTTSDATKATVSNKGVVTAVAAGSATITATSNNNQTATCAVTVTAA